MHHRRATTSWFLGPEFLKRYPDRRPRSRHHGRGRREPVTVGAAFAHIDLALSLKRTSTRPNMSPSFLIIDERPSVRPSSPTNISGTRTRSSSSSNASCAPAWTNVQRRLRRAVARHPSRRTLERRVCAALNLTPCSASSNGFASNEPRHLSATTDLTSAEIALRGRLRERRDSALPPAW